MSRVWRSLRKHWSKAFGLLALAGLLSLVRWALPVQPRMVWHVPETCVLAAFSGDGRTVATECRPENKGEDNPGRLRIWDAVSGRERATIDVGQIGSSANESQLSPDGRILLVHTLCRLPPVDDQWFAAVTLFDLSSGGVVGRFYCVRNEDPRHLAVNRTRFSANSQSVAYTAPPDDDGQTAVCLWDIARQRERLRLVGHATPIFSADGSKFATTFDSNPPWQRSGMASHLDYPLGVAVWDVAAGRELSWFTIPVDCRLQELAFSADGGRLALVSSSLAATADGAARNLLKVQIGEVATGAILMGYETNGILVAESGAALENRLFVGDGPDTAPIFCLADGRWRGAMRAEAMQAEIDRLSECIFRRGRGPESTANATIVAKTTFERDPPPRWRQWLDDHIPWLPISDERNRDHIELWDLQTGEKLAVLRGEEDFEYSTDGKLLALRSDDRTIEIWDLPPRKPLGWFLAIAAVVPAIPAALWWRTWRRRAKGDERYVNESGYLV